MTVLIIQSLLLIAIAYILGCMIGHVLHRFFDDETAMLATPEPAEVAASSVAVSAKVSTPPPVAKPHSAPVAKPKAKVSKTAVASKPKVASSKTPSDDLKRIKGIGPQIEARLNNSGIKTFAQIAGWSAKDQKEVGAKLAFSGRIEREEWVKQAKTLKKGGDTAFSKRVDKGEVDSSMGKASADNMGKKPSAMAKEPTAGSDNLTLIDGVGNAIEKKLFALGIYKFSQITKWTTDNQVWIGNEIGFPGRPERENWAEEAKALAKGNVPTPVKKAKRGEIKSSRKPKK